MHFAFSPEQEELLAVVRRFLADRSPELEVRRLIESEQGFDSAVWRQLGDDLGVLGLAVPEEHGGPGYGFVQVGVVLVEAGRALLCAPYFSVGGAARDLPASSIPRLQLVPAPLVRASVGLVWGSVSSSACRRRRPPGRGRR